MAFSDGFAFLPLTDEGDQRKLKSNCIEGFCNGNSREVGSSRFKIELLNQNSRLQSYQQPQMFLQWMTRWYTINTYSPLLQKQVSFISEWHSQQTEQSYYIPKAKEAKCALLAWQILNSFDNGREAENRTQFVELIVALFTSKEIKVTDYLYFIP